MRAMGDSLRYDVRGNFVTPYRGCLINYAFGVNFDAWDLASCLSCTSVRAFISHLHGPLYTACFPIVER